MVDGAWKEDKGQLYLARTKIERWKLTFLNNLVVTARGWCFRWIGIMNQAKTMAGKMVHAIHLGEAVLEYSSRVRKCEDDKIA